MFGSILLEYIKKKKKEQGNKTNVIKFSCGKSCKGMKDELNKENRSQNEKIMSHLPLKQKHILQCPLIKQNEIFMSLHNCY